MAMSPKAIAIFCLAIVPISYCYDNIDAFMSGEQIQQIFHADADSVPMHEVIEINFHERNKRDLHSAGTRMVIGAFGEEHQLNLHPIKSPFEAVGPRRPFFTHEAGEGGPVDYRRHDDETENVGQLFEDLANQASLIIGKDAYGNDTVMGHIGKKGLTIKPLPADVSSAYVKNKRSIDNSFSLNSPLHVVYKTNENFDQDHSINAIIDQAIHNKRNVRSTDLVPYVIHLEIFIYTDNDMYKAFGSNLKNLIEHLTIFWNGVFQKFNNFRRPIVLFQVSQSIVAGDDDSSPFFMDNMVPGDQNSIYAEQALEGAQKFFYSIKNRHPLSSYDIAVVMTRRNMIMKNDQRVFGISSIGGACKINEAEESLMSVAIVQDVGGFLGVETAAHELGHLLGLQDDVKGSNCSNGNDYIMSSTTSHNKTLSAFSECSITQLRKQFEDDKLTCLFNSPYRPIPATPNSLPGYTTSLEEQCRRHGQGLPCSAEDWNICVSYACLDEKGRCFGVLAGALDGTPCRKINNVARRFCYHTECVPFTPS